MTITKSSTRIVAIVAGFAVALSLLVGAFATTAQAAALTQSQINAIISLLQSFGADATTVANVTASLNGQATSGSTGGSSSVSCTFTRSLTMGSSGADVTCLQQGLIAMGYSIPAGATGYFGAQTQTAVAAWQTAKGISPAAGYFGPISQAAWGTSSTPTTPTTPTTPSGSLNGGEADLSDFEFSREESSGAEGDEAVEVATAEFDVEDGDVRVERLELLASSTNAALGERPWDYFDRVSIWMNGEEVAEMDVDDRDAWDEEDGDGDDIYRLVITGIDEIVREDDRAEITVAFDISSNISDADLAQDFVFQIPQEGIRAVDGQGIQNYIGISNSQDELPGTDSDETVTFGFDEEESGDLDLETNSGDPDATTLVSDEDEESEEYTVFVFDIQNNDDADSLITDLTFTVATSSGDALGDIIDSFVVSADGDEYDCDVNNDGTVECENVDIEIGGDDTMEFTVMVTIKENAPESTIDISLAASGVEAEGVDSGEDSDVSGSVSSETHTISTSGMQLSSGSRSADVDDINGQTGTFEITFNVEALEEDIYIYNGVAQSGATAFEFGVTGALASTSGVSYTVNVGGSASSTNFNADSALLQSDADLVGNYFIVEAGETEEFTLTVTLNPAGGSTALHYVELDALRFDDSASPDTTADDTVFTVPNESRYETPAVSINP